MGLLPFEKKYKPKLLGKTKKTTIRPNRVKGVDLFIWCPTPRFGRGDFLGTSRGEDWDQTATRGRDFTEQMANNDGFGTVQELKKALMGTYDMTMGAVDSHVWYIVRFDWTEGPNGH